MFRFIERHDMVRTFEISDGTLLGQSIGVFRVQSASCQTP